MLIQAEEIIRLHQEKEDPSMATFMMGLEFKSARKFSRGDVLELPDSTATVTRPGFYMGKPRKPASVIFDRDVELPAGHHILNLEIDVENSHVVNCEHYDAPSESDPARHSFLVRVYLMFPNLRGASFAEVIKIFEEHYVRVTTTVDYVKTDIGFELTPGQYQWLIKVTRQKIVQ